MKKESFEQLKKHIEESLTLDKENVMNKTLELSMLHDNVLRLYLKESRNLKILKTERDYLYGKKYHHYKFQFEYELGPKNEIETYIFADDEYHQKRLIVQEQEVVVDYLQGVMDNIKQTSFQIKAYVDLLRIQQGL